MRRFDDVAASLIQAGDTVIDPHSGVLAQVDSTETHGAMVAIHMRGSVSLSYMGLSCAADRVLRRLYRPAPVAQKAARK